MLWGTNRSGGQGMGFVYRFNADGSNFNIVKTFEHEGSNPGTHPLFASDGFVYGVFYGKNKSIFKIRPDGTDLSVIHTFNGELPMDGLIELNGFLYGTTWDGGVSDLGTLYRMRPDGSDFTFLHEFSGAKTPVNIRGGLLLASDGHIYGTSSSGGMNGTGAVFKLNTDTHTVSTVYSIASSGGDTPNGYLIEGADGFLYGTCSSGTSSATAGSLFKVRKDGTGFVTLRSFADYSNGQNIYGSVLEVPDNALIGTFNYGGQFGSGGLYRINTDGTGFKLIHSFQSKEEGNQPYGELIFHDGFIYGNTVQGGLNGLGTLYKMRPDGTQFTKLVDWDKVRGKNHSSLILHDDVIYYTAQGGISDAGVLGVLNSKTELPEVIRDFNPLHGGEPGKLLYHSNGMVYGRTATGGQYGKGTLFRLDPSNDEYELLIHFKEDFLGCDLIEKANGKILGAIRSSAGTTISSEIFEYDFETNQYKFVYKFESQYLSHIWESYNGDVMGNVTSTRGDGEMYTFKMDSAYSKFNKLAGISSGTQWVNFEQDTSMMMAGSTYSGGTSIVSSYDYLTDKVKSLHRFDFPGPINGRGPIGPLSILDNGKIVGAFDGGGTYGQGFLYSMNLDGSSYQKLYDFSAEEDITDGVTRVTDELFYGVITSSALSGVFRFDISQGFSMLKTFDGSNNQYGNSELVRVNLNTPRMQFYGDLRFGALEIYDALEKEIRIKNAGGGDLTIKGMTVPDGYTISGATSFTLRPGVVQKIKVAFKPTKTQRYAGVLSINSNSSSKNSMSVTGNGILVTAIEEAFDSLVSVYPNPTNDKLIIECAIGLESITLVDSMGKTIKQMRSSTERLQIDLANLRPGVYTLIVQTGQGIVSKRVLKH